MDEIHAPDRGVLRASAKSRDASPLPNQKRGLVLRLASAVMDGGSRVRIITEKNGDGGMVPLTSAVESGVAFAAYVREDILALDADSDREVICVTELAAELRRFGYTPVIVASGTPGRCHLFARVGDAQYRERLAQRAKRAGVDVRRGSSPIRPPLSPHARGLETRLAGLTPEEAIEALAPVLLTDLTAATEHLLRTGTAPDLGREDGTVDFSQVMWRVVLGMVNKGWSVDMVRDALLQTSNRGGRHLQRIQRERGLDAARYDIGRTFTRARAWVSQNAGIRDRHDAASRLAELDQLVQETAWKGRQGATDRRIMLLLINIGLRLHLVEFDAAIRRLADEAGCRPPTVRKARERLVADGWLIPTQSKSALATSRWRINLDRLGDTQDPVVSRPPYEMSTGTLVTAGADAFRGRGNEWWIYEQLGRYPGRTASELAVLTNIPRRTVSRRLGGLAIDGLAIADEHRRWSAVPNDLKEVAMRRGKEGASERQRHRHEAERRLFAERVVPREGERSEKPEVSDTAPHLGWSC
jgi:hypothetical protein